VKAPEVSPHWSSHWQEITSDLLRLSGGAVIPLCRNPLGPSSSRCDPSCPIAPRFHPAHQCWGDRHEIADNRSCCRCFRCRSASHGVSEGSQRPCHQALHRITIPLDKPAPWAVSETREGCGIVLGCPHDLGLVHRWGGAKRSRRSDQPCGRGLDCSSTSGLLEV
jgi:hypothetical protein